MPSRIIDEEGEAYFVRMSELSELSEIQTNVARRGREVVQLVRMGGYVNLLPSLAGSTVLSPVTEYKWENYA